MSAPNQAPRRVAALSILFSSLAVASIALANIGFSASDVPTVFFIDKSDDHNRVDYGIRLNASCQPASRSPMVVYWRQFEDGADGRVTHGLNIFEGPVYGVGGQRVIDTQPTGGSISMAISALSSRRLIVHSARDANGTCTAQAVTAIGGSDARLNHVHLTLGDGPGSLRFVDIYGTSIATGAAVTERLVR